MRKQMHVDVRKAVRHVLVVMDVLVAVENVLTVASGIVLVPAQQPVTEVVHTIVKTLVVHHVPVVAKVIAMDNVHPVTDVVPVMAAMVRARLDVTAVATRACTQMYN